MSIINPELAAKTKSRPVLLVMAFLVAIDVVLSGSALGEYLDGKAIGLALLFSLAIKAGLAFYLQNAVVPAEDAVAYVNKDREVVAGEASYLRTGTPIGQVIPETGDDYTPEHSAEHGAVDIALAVGLLLVILGIAVLLGWVGGGNVLGVVALLAGIGVMAFGRFNSGSRR